MINGPDLPDTSWVGRIPDLGEEELRRRLSALPVRRQAEIFSELDPKERLKLVRCSDRPGALVAALPEEEVFYTIKDSDISDALPLLARTTPSQLSFILDVELWRRDEIDRSRMVVWLRNLLACGESKLIQLAEHADFELLVLMLGQLISLIPNEEDQPLAEGLPAIMADDFFTILARIPSEAENIQLILRVLRSWDRDRFYKLLYGVYGSHGVENEAEAFRWRNSRLAEKGLVEFEEAVEIYGYMEEGESREALDGEGISARWKTAGGRMPPAYPVALAPGHNLLHELLTSASGRELQNRLRAEIAFCANRLLVADAESIGDPDSMKRALHRLFRLTNLGLLFLSGGDRARAGEALARLPVRTLFQIGFSRALDLKSEARDIASRWWPRWRESGFGFLGHPDEEVMRGLLMRVPQVYTPEHLGFRDFETMQEVKGTRGALERVRCLAHAAFDRLGIPPPHEAPETLTGVEAVGTEEIDFARLLLTGFVNHSLDGRFDIRPLTPGRWRKFFTGVLEPGPAGAMRLRRKTREAFLDWLSAETAGDDCSPEVIRDFMNGAFQALEEDLSGLHTPDLPAPRYLPHLLF
jgi:hypothetical protein